MSVELSPEPNAGGMAELRVADTGVGIPADKLEAIFEPFVWVGRSLSSPSEGTGLGLAISRDLARGMGGTSRLRARSAPEARSRSRCQPLSATISRGGAGALGDILLSIKLLHGISRVVPWRARESHRRSPIGQIDVAR